MINFALLGIPDASKSDKSLAFSSSVRRKTWRWMLGSVLGVRPPLFCFLLLFSFITNPFYNPYKTLTSEGVFCPLQRASCFEALTRFRVPQNTTTYRVPVNTKIRPAGRIKCNREKRLDAVLFRVHFVKMLLHKSVNKIPYTK